MINCMKNLFPLLSAAVILFSCSDASSPATSETGSDTSKAKQDSTTQAPKTDAPVADAATIMARKQVPILCYHHIREIRMASKANKGYEVTVAQFKEQMKALADSGYTSITPDQYYEYLTKGTPLPAKPVMITFDDTSLEHFTIAKPEMEKYGFKGVFYIMTISINRPNYMSTAQIKQLADDGHIIGSHTWDHHRVDRYKAENTIEERGVKKVVNDWDQQLAGTKKKLEEITGKPCEHFAYPFGIWSKDGIPEIEKRGYKMAYQLSTPRDSTQPLYTARRMIVSPEWTAGGMIRVMKSTFK